jgi:hypothetical protein
MVREHAPDDVRQQLAEASLFFSGLRESDLPKRPPRPSICGIGTWSPILRQTAVAFSSLKAT